MPAIGLKRERIPMKVIVIKCGGSVIDKLTDGFYESLATLKKDGYSFVFVHGGGPDINEMLEKLEVPVQFSGGLRKTSNQTLEIAELVLAGKTNRKLVHQLQSRGFQSVGLNGSDLSILEADYIDQETLGEVGIIQKVDTTLFDLILSAGIYPVLTPISITNKGKKLNVNADMVAGAVAASLQAELCIFITDVEGVRYGTKILKQLSELEINHLIENGIINGGMIPKVKAAVQAKHQGAEKILITSGVANFYADDKWKGTLIG